jgi:hypothetical protein
MVYGTFQCAGVDYNLTLCPIKSRLHTHLPWATMTESTLSPSQGLWIWPLAIEDFLETMMKDDI